MFGVKKLREENLRLQAKDENHKGAMKRKDDEIERLNDEIKSMERKVTAVAEDQKVKDRNINRKHDEQVGDLEDANERLEGRIETLEQAVEDQNELDRRKIEIESKEVLLRAREVNADNLSKKVADAKTKGETEAEKRYQAGYADGCADGLRRAHEITAEDRRATVQIAALAAASHQPDMTKQIATALAKDFTKSLPSGYNVTSKKK